MSLLPVIDPGFAQSRHRQVASEMLPQSFGVALQSRHAVRRLSVFALGDRVPQIAASAWVAPSASVMGNVSLEADSSVWFGATIRYEALPVFALLSHPPFWC